MARIPRDSDSEIVQEHPVVIYSPSRRRDRFPENCVEVCASEQEAIDRASGDKNTHAAVALGPSRSSEGFRLYYLVRWLA